MKNIINEKPTNKLAGRMLFSVKFVDGEDIRNKRILNIGCGYGWFELYALQKDAKEIIGTEVSDDDLSTARKYINHSKVKFIAADDGNLPLDDQDFDTITLWEVLEHIPRGTEARLFKEIYRVLKPGGVFYLSTPHRSFFSNISDPAWWLIGHRHYSNEQLTALLAHNDFKILDTKIKGGKWDLINNLNMYFSKWILRRSPILNSFFYNKIDREYGRNGFLSVFIKSIK